MVQEFAVFSKLPLLYPLLPAPVPWFFEVKSTDRSYPHRVWGVWELLALRCGLRITD